MELIRKIEIHNFRSNYRVVIDKLSGTNIFFGRNDAGKSNVLRALNLFFNNETNPGQTFDFERDFCHARRQEATERNIKKPIFVKIWIAPPPSWQKSLGKLFWVKKQWSVTRPADPHFITSATTPKIEQYAARFLNKVRFHYIPAIKDRRIFENLLGEIYRVLASQEEFSRSLEKFSGTLRTRTSELTTDLSELLGVNSAISPPDDLSGLFRSLDFETRIEQGDSYSLTLQRGDGIQVRHLPAILAFISDKGKHDFNIWGFEEPENSLELENAIREAETFRRYGSAPNKQVFLTSHSPAFFSLDKPDVSRYFVSRTESHGERLTSTIRQIPRGRDEDPVELMGETPHLAVISSHLMRAHARIKQLQLEGETLVKELARGKRPLVFVEGVSDVTVLTAAWRAIIGEEMPFDFQECEGTTKMLSLGSDGPVLNKLAPARTLFVIVDNDIAGRELYNNGKLEKQAWVRNNSNKVHWCRLPFSREFRDFMEGIGIIDKTKWPGTIENMIPPATREKAMKEGILKLTNIPHAELLAPSEYRKICSFLSRADSPERHWVLTLDPESKIPFARWLAQESAADPGIMAAFEPVMRGIHDILQGETRQDGPAPRPAGPGRLEQHEKTGEEKKT